MPFTPTVTLTPRPEVQLLRARLSATIDPQLRALTDVRLAGALRIADLDRVYRQIPGSEELPASTNNIRTWIDDAAQGIQPDIDLDLDGSSRSTPHRAGAFSAVATAAAHVRDHATAGRRAVERRAHARAGRRLLHRPHALGDRARREPLSPLDDDRRAILAKALKVRHAGGDEWPE